MNENNNNRPNTPEEKKYSGDYPEIYGEELDVEAIQNRMKRKKATVQSVLAFFFLIIVFTVFGSQNKEEIGDYIDGNVLYFPTVSMGQRELQPMGNPWLGANLVGQVLYAPLFMTDSTYTQINPRLANNLEISEDGLTYSFTMGDNYWSDGTPLTMPST